MYPIFRFGKFLAALLLALCVLGLISNSNVHAIDATKFYLHEVPYIHQADPYWCGPASLAMVLNYWGANVTQEEVAADIYDNENRLTNIANMTMYPKKLGFKTEGSIGSISALEDWVSRGYPLIVLQKLSLSNAYGHYRVVVGYNGENKTVTTYDSINGENYNIPYDQFEELWKPGTTFSTNNWTLLISPQNSVLTDLMSEKQTLSNLTTPSKDEQIRITLYILAAVSAILAVYSLTITVIHFSRKRPFS